MDGKELKIAVVRTRFLLSQLEKYPVSDKSILISGALGYCEMIARKVSSDDWYNWSAIEDYVSYVDFLISLTHKHCEVLYLLDITLLEEIFDGIQNACVKRVILPRLVDLSLPDLET